jgi:hypothetical protein
MADDKDVRFEVEPDAVYVGFGERLARVETTVPLSELVEEWEIPALANLNLAFDKQGRLLGLEILSPTSVLPK